MENKENVSVIPEYTLIKKVILGQFYTSQSALTQYDLSPSLKNETLTRESLILLSRSLSFKSYILQDPKLKSWFNTFISQPYNFRSFSLHVVFSLCHLIIELMGLLKIENENPDKEKSYLEV